MNYHESKNMNFNIKFYIPNKKYLTTEVDSDRRAAVQVDKDNLKCVVHFKCQRNSD